MSVLERIIEYNLPLTDAAHRVARADGKGDLTAEALRRKLDALAEDPFRFFRGTFHLMAADALDTGAPHGLIVGDLHLENFGVYRGASGALAFDVNDFDDVGVGPLDFDLRRLCTSAMLLPSMSTTARTAAAKAIARGWVEELDKLGGRFPVLPWTEDKAEGTVRALLREKGCKTREELLAKVTDHRKLAQLEGKLVRPAKEWIDKVHAAVAAYVESLRQLKARDLPRGEVLDVAYRFRGTGSLGRLRFTVLLEGGRLIEIKEARPSALERTAGLDRARVQTASIRRMQGDPWPYVAATSLGKVLALGRENGPEEQKIARDQLSAQDLASYARQCGQVLARLHARANAPAILRADWKPALAAQAAVEFAASYAAKVQEDWKAFTKGRAQAAKALLPHDMRAL